MNCRDQNVRKIIEEKFYNRPTRHQQNMRSVAYIRSYLVGRKLGMTDSTAYTYISILNL